MLHGSIARTDETEGTSEPIAVVREATHEDVAVIAEMGREFHGVAGWADIADYDFDSTSITLHTMVDSPDMILLIAERAGEPIGMAGGAMSPLYFNHAHRIGQELFYWIQPSSRNGAGKLLLDQLEGIARERGCDSWIMVALDQVSPEVTGRLYRMRGYRPAERNWIRKL